MVKSSVLEVVQTSPYYPCPGASCILHLQLINTKYPLITMQQQLKHAAAEPLSLNIGSFYKPILPVKEMKDCQLELLCLAAIC